MNAGRGPMACELTFGDAGTEVWGVVWGGVEPGGVIAAPGASIAVSGLRLDDAGGDPDAAWSFVADGLELAVLPAREPAMSGADEFDQLCEVQGHVTIAGTEHTIACLGRRAAR